MEESKRKNNFFYVIILFLTLITLVVGITFTYFSLVAKEKDDSTIIKTGVLDIKYEDGRTINMYSLLPTSEPNLNTKYSVYKKNFSVANIGTLEENYDIYINVTKNEFEDGSLYYALYNENGRKIKKGVLPKNGKVILDSNINLKVGKKKNYTALIWLQENNKNQDYEQGNVFIGGFDITATQIKYE